MIHPKIRRKASSVNGHKTASTRTQANTAFGSLVSGCWYQMAPTWCHLVPDAYFASFLFSGEIGDFLRAVRPEIHLLCCRLSSESISIYPRFKKGVSISRGCFTDAQRWDSDSGANAHSRSLSQRTLLHFESNVWIRASSINTDGTDIFCYFPISR